MSKDKQDLMLSVSGWRAYPVQMIYTALAIAFGVEAWVIHQWWFWGEALLGIVACLWLIHCRKPILCTCKDEYLEVAIAPQDIWESLKAAIGIRKYIRIPYSIVVGIAPNWRQLLIANSSSGGLLVIPVEWNELSPRGRGQILRRIEENRQVS